MKKSKAKEVDLLYVPENEKNKKVAGKRKPTTQKTKKKEKKETDESFNIDDEIVIGITKQNDKETGKKDKKSKRNKKKEAKQEDKKHSKRMRVFKYIVLFMIILGSAIAFILSPVFDTKKITVNGNSKISNEEIISLSGIKLDENLFKIRKKQVEKNIKENAYIDEVRIERKLPSEIEINVTERIPAYMIEDINGLVYINNQGYILEISNERLPLPVLSGIETLIEDLKVGGRLCKEDLKKLGTVSRLMETANSYEMGALITEVNIVDKYNYTLYLKDEKKTVYIGDASNINTKMMYLKMILEKEKGIESEIFLNGDLNKTDVYTREKV